MVGYPMSHAFYNCMTGRLRTKRSCRREQMRGAPAIYRGRSFVVFMEKYKYWHNLVQMPVVAVLFAAGVLCVLYGIVRTLVCKTFRRGIWWTGAGTVLAVMALFMLAGYGGTAYYPSYSDLQSSLTIVNSCSSEFTLRVMTYVSFIIPFVLAYIAYAWWKMDRRRISSDELEGTQDKY